MATFDITVGAPDTYQQLDLTIPRDGYAFWNVSPRVQLPADFIRKQPGAEGATVFVSSIRMNFDYRSGFAVRGLIRFHLVHDIEGGTHPRFAPDLERDGRCSYAVNYLRQGSPATARPLNGLPYDDRFRNSDFSSFVSDWIRPSVTDAARFIQALQQRPTGATFTIDDRQDDTSSDITPQPVTPAAFPGIGIGDVTGFAFGATKLTGMAFGATKIWPKGPPPLTHDFSIVTGTSLGIFGYWLGNAGSITDATLSTPDGTGATIRQCMSGGSVGARLRLVLFGLTVAKAAQFPTKLTCIYSSGAPSGAVSVWENPTAAAQFGQGPARDYELTSGANPFTHSGRNIAVTAEW